MAKKSTPKNKRITYARHRPLEERNKKYRRKSRDILLSLVNRVLLCTNEIDVDACVALARALNMSGITRGNYLVALRFLETNNSHVVNALIGRRKPALLFSAIRPNWYLVKEAFRLLAQFSRETLLDKVLVALLGTIQSAYKKSRYGYSVYPLSISDAYGIGKYLDKDETQDAPNNRLLLDLLFDIYQMGLASEDEKMKSVALSVNLIRMAFFDDTKRMTDVIPEVLLVSDTLFSEVGTRFVGGGDAE
ncbi:MAG TPA: hypothetical protein VMW87_16985 [Spirochaetia bacterium]|nr:hypothetical protein [Spirochaetia bacterium]